MTSNAVAHDEYIDIPAPKPAYQTTEFWLTTLPVILYLVKAFTGNDTSGVDIEGLSLLAAAIATGLYALARSFTKRGVALALAQVATTRLSIVHDEKREERAFENQLRLDQARMSMAASRNESVLEDDVAALEEKLAHVIEALVPRKQNGDVDTRTKAGKKAVELGLIQAA